MYPFYLGIDLHLKRTYMVLMDAKGEVIDRERISNQEITKYLQEKVPQETYAVLEVTRDQDANKNHHKNTWWLISLFTL